MCFACCIVGDIYKVLILSMNCGQMITYTHPGKLFTSFHCDYKANGRSLTFRWPIKYPAARGRHNCKVLHYCLCVRNDGAQAGSRAVFSTSSQVFSIQYQVQYLVSSISMTNKIYSCKGVPQLSSLAFIALACEMTVPKLDPEQCSVHLHKRSILSPVWIRRYYQVFC